MTGLRKALFALVAALSVVAIAIGARTGGPSPEPATEPAIRTPSKTVFRNVRVFDGTRVIPRATVVIDGSQIIAVGADLKVPSGARVIDGHGRTLMPGMIDSHTHSFGDALDRALQFGVTTQLDMFTPVALMQQARKDQKAGKATGRADLYSAGTLMTAPGGHGTQFFPIDTIKDSSEVPAFVKARVEEGSDYIKVVYDDGSAYGISFPSIDLASVQAAIDAGHASKKKVMVHVSTLDRAKEVIRAGADGLVHTFGDVPPDAEIVSLAKKGGAFIIPTLTVIESTTGKASGVSLAEDSRIAPFLTAEEVANLKKAFPVREKAARSMIHASESVQAFVSAGIPVLAGSDAPNPGTSYGASMHRELELLVAAGLSPVQALSAATSVPAMVFGLEDRGRIGEGLRADLLLVAGDPTSRITDSRNIEGIWKQGVELVRVKPVQAPKTTAVAAEVPSSGLISDFESEKIDASFGSGWIASTDTMAGGKSSASIALSKPGSGSSKGALAIEGELRQGFAYPWAGAMFSPAATPMQPVDLSKWTTISFSVRGDVSSGQLMVFAAHLGRIPASTSFPVTEEWTEVTVSFADLQLGDRNDIQAIFVGASKLGAFRFEIDDVQLR